MKIKKSPIILLSILLTLLFSGSLCIYAQNASGGSTQSTDAARDGSQNSGDQDRDLEPSETQSAGSDATGGDSDSTNLPVGEGVGKAPGKNPYSESEYASEYVPESGALSKGEEQRTTSGTDASSGEHNKKDSSSGNAHKPGEPKAKADSDSDTDPYFEFEEIQSHDDDTVRVFRRKRRPIKQQVESWALTSGVKIILIIIGTGVAWKLTSLLSKTMLKLITRNKQGTEMKKRADTLSSVIRYVLIALVVLIAVTMILKELTIDIGPLLAGAGVVGLAVGFGAQNLIKDLISGFFILLEDQIRVGDVVQIADKRGTVEKVTLRMVVLRDVSGNVHYIPSGEISIVTNMTKEFSRYVFDIRVSYKEDVDKVIALMRSIDEGLRAESDYKDLILAKLEVFGLQRFEESFIIIRARTKTLPGKQWKVGREFNRRLKKAFEKDGIETPYPHLRMYRGDSSRVGGLIPEAMTEADALDEGSDGSGDDSVALNEQ